MPRSFVKRTTTGQSRMGALAGTPPTPVTPKRNPPSGSASNMTQADINAMIQRQRAVSDAQTRAAVNLYTDPNPNHGGYAISQSMNHALNNNGKLTKQQQDMADQLDRIMVPIGKETYLYRANHDGFLLRQGLDPQQIPNTKALKKALVGATWTEKGFSSTSHDTAKNPFWAGNYMGGGREVLMRIHTAAGAKAALVQSSQAEVLLARGTKYRITDAKFTGGWAYPQKGGRKKIIEIDVEVW